jgi:hypothetical protein
VRRPACRDPSTARGTSATRACETRTAKRGLLASTEAAHASARSSCAGPNAAIWSPILPTAAVVRTLVVPTRSAAPACARRRRERCRGGGRGRRPAGATDH